MPPGPVIATRQLTKHFGSVVAVEDLDLEVEPGEVFGYLGPNGAGKTTTIRLLLDFIRPTRGTLEVLGGTGAQTDIRRRIGYLPGELHLDPRYTGAELFRFFGELRGGIDRTRLDELCRRFGLDPSRPVEELSTGNRRKIGVIQAFMHRPELLILDEPTSGLDPLLQYEFHHLVREAVGDGATVFLSSHVLHEVEQLAGRVGILRRGRLVTVASVDELRRQVRQRLDLHIDGRFSARAFARIPEVVSADAAGSVLHLVVEGSVDQVIKTAARYRVTRIVSHETDLEDVFLRYYREEEQ